MHICGVRLCSLRRSLSLRANCAATLPSWDTLTTCFFVTVLCALAVADGGGDADAGDIDDDDDDDEPE